MNVKDIMDTWTLQMNYPVVRVTVQNGKINIRQIRFLSNPDAVDPGKYTSPFGFVLLFFNISYQIQPIVLIQRPLDQRFTSTCP